MVGGGQGGLGLATGPTPVCGAPRRCALVAPAPERKEERRNYPPCGRAAAARARCACCAAGYLC
jgi:hypothetical protein